MAWQVAGAAFIVGFVVFGVTYSFGTFLLPLTLEFQISQASGSAFFAASGAGFYLLGPLTGYLGDKFGPRITTAIGAILISGGLVLTATAQSIWSAYLAYGVGVGLGASFAYIPSLATVGLWFARWRASALGFVAAGTALGVVVLPPLSAWLIERIGWRQTYLIFGLLTAIVLTACSLSIRRSPVETKNNQPRLRRVLLSSAFVRLYLSWLLVTTALFVAFVFLPAFARQRGASETEASMLLSLIGGVSLFGRLSTGRLGKTLGTLPMFRGSVALMAASFAIWLVAARYAELIVFASLLGLGYGMRIALMPVVLIELFGPQQLGKVFGFFFTGTGLASIIGPIAAGAIVDWTGTYSWAVVFAMTIAAIGALLVVPARPGSFSGIVFSNELY